MFMVTYPYLERPR